MDKMKLKYVFDLVHSSKSKPGIDWLLHDDKSSKDLAKVVQDKVKTLSLCRYTVLAFYSTSLYESYLHKQRNLSSIPGLPSLDSAAIRGCLSWKDSKLNKDGNDDTLKTLLPKRCTLCGITGMGVVGTSLSDLDSDIQELENSRALSCLFIPPIDNVSIQEFRISPSQIQTLPGHISDVTLHNITGLSKERKTKLILLFYSEEAENIIDGMCTAFFRNYNNVVIAGGYVDNLVPQRGDNTDRGVFGMAFCGEGVKVCSILLKRQIRNKMQVIRNLDRLKENHTPGAYNVGFMFACLGRGLHHYQEQNVEANSFHQAFPDIPLLGFFGNGELGHDHLPKYMSGGTKPDIELRHSFTTIFVMLSLG